MFSSVYRQRNPIFTINKFNNLNNLNNFNNLNNDKFRKYITDSTNNYIQKKLEYNNKPYIELINNKNDKKIVVDNNFFAFATFLSIYGILYYFYNKKH